MIAEQRCRECTHDRVSDRGSASVWLLAVGLLLLAAGLVGSALGAAVVARHQAQSAADLGALAGAARAVEGSGAACDRAAEMVTANGARLTHCALDGLDLSVTVEVVPAARLGRAAAATARAGPVRADDSRSAAALPAAARRSGLGEGVQGGEVVGGGLPAAGGHVGAYLVRPGGAGDHAGDRRLRGQPADRHVQQAEPALGGIVTRWRSAGPYRSPGRAVEGRAPPAG